MVNNSTVFKSKSEVISMSSYEGICGCGNIEYSFEDEPINTAFCYCRECQTHTGSDKWFGLWVPVDKFKFTKGIPSTYTRLGDSGKEVIYQFCSECGTTLCAEIILGNFYSVGASTLRDNNHFAPKMAIYTKSAPDWAVYPDHIPKFDKLPTGINL
jgi:hypothetical protein